MPVVTSDKLAMVLKELQAVVGPKDVISNKKDLLTYRYAATTSGPAPLAVIFPESTEEVSRVLRILHNYKVPVIARGAGTNLNGGTVLSQEAVILELAKMNKILGVDLLNRYMAVEPGVTNLEVQKALEPYGFFFAPDPASQQVSTMGGNIAENAGGPRCIKYGVTANHVLGLEVVLSDGQVFVANGPLEGTPGFDLTGIMHATEGTFGIVTKAWLRIMKKPEAIKTLMAVFDTLEDAAKTVSQIIAQGIIPTTLELIDRPVLKAVEETVKIGYPLDAEAVLLIEVDGYADSLDSQAEKIISICRENRVRETKVAKTEKERELLWSGRRGAVGSIARLRPSYAEEDITIPRTQLPQMLKTIAQIAGRHSLIIGNVFHAGDGNFHPVVLYDARDPEETQRVILANFEIMQEAAKIGGTVSGEHGIGLEKLKGMPLIFSVDDMAFMRRLKLAFDPGDLLNPGKVIPADICELVSTTVGKPNDDGGRGGEKEQFLRALTGKVQASGIYLDEQQVAHYALDRGKPWCVVKPENPAEVASVLQLANQFNVKVSPLGKGTKKAVGLNLGPHDVVVDLGNLNQVLEIDVGNLTATVEAGLELEVLQAALNEKGLMLPVDPLEVGSPTVGGIVAANSTGSLRLQYKTLKDLVLGFEIVTPEGKLVRYGGKNLKNVAGYDLCKLLVGSWGTVGILTKLTLKLYPLPEKAVYRTYVTEDNRVFTDFLLAIQNADLEPTSFDVLVSQRKYHVNLCMSGPKESVARQLKALDQLVKPGLEKLKEIEDRNLSFGRAFVFEKLPQGLYDPAGLVLKSSLLFADIPGWIERILSLNTAGNLIVYGQAANGIMYAIFPKGMQDHEFAALNGIITRFKESLPWGIHAIEVGTGINPTNGAHDPEGLISQRIKTMLDPNNILNPGRTVGGITV